MTTSASGPDRTVDAITDRFVEDAARLDPIVATYVGITSHDDELPDYSPDGFAAREEMVAASLAAARAATPVDEREAVARDAFVERLSLDVAMTEAGYARSELSVISSPLHELRQVFDLMPTEG